VSASPTAVRASRPAIVYVYLAIMVGTWAGNWPLMKLALGDAPPMQFVLIRLIGAAALLSPFLLAVREPALPVLGERLGLAWVGLLQVAGFMIFGIIGLSIVPAGRAIVLAYTMPLWAIPIGLTLWPEAFGWRQFGGAAVGFAGIVLFMNPGLIDWSNARVLAGNAFLIAAAICWALGSCFYRSRSWRSPFWTQTFWQISVSIPPVAALAVFNTSGQPIHWSAKLVAILVYNWIVSTALGYFLWNKVLTMIPASVAGQVMALTPVGGFLLSIAIFGGAVGGDVIVSIALIIAGIILTLRR
jgi:drug/metabolite transporter (DMT)-like permease